MLNYLLRHPKPDGVSLLSFVHLHNHTEYSLLDGAMRVKSMVKRAKELGMPAVAITDHGYMYGVVEAALAGKAAGIDVILGCETYVAPRSLTDKDAKSGDDEPGHLVLLAMNDAGYRNLIKMVSVACVDGFYYRPRVDRELLSKHSNGLIALSACVAGEIPRLLLGGQEAEARALIEYYCEIFNGRFYLELQRHGLPEEDAVNAKLIKLGREMGVGLVATNDTHYISRADAKYHDVMLCMQTARRVNDANRLRFPNDQFYLKSCEEMETLFNDVPEAVANTVAIANACKVDLRFGEYHLPEYKIPNGYTADSYLRELCMSGAKERYPSGGSEVQQRLDYELSTIAHMGFSSYFLVVWDFIKYAKENGIAVGPGRGSSAGSIVAYVLGITDVDPLRYGLLFERFLNAERVSMPDIDVDFDDKRRQEVIDYVTRLYGVDRVAQITTFGTLKARSAIRDVARALDMPLSKADRLAKLVPFSGSDIGELISGPSTDSSIAELQKMYASDPQAKDVLDAARFVEGFPRHASIHAAGVVITKDPVSDLVPLARSRDGMSSVTQFTMGTLEKLGLLKMDFLGLSNLNVIKDTLALIERTSDVRLDMSQLALNDRKTMGLFASGSTIGVFQFESSGMRQMLQEFRPQSFEDLILLNAAYRPGPMQMIPTIIDVRHKRKEPAYLHPLMEPILSETYGSIVYQEQVMQLVKSLAGFSLGRADLLRRAMGKKQRDIMDRERENFIQGCSERGIDSAVANQIYDLIAKFAEYGFPKPHSTAYSLVAYQTAYLKAHHPCEFICAKLTSEAHNASKVAFYISEARRLGLDVAGPDVNRSGVDFEPAGNTVLFGFSAVKNIGRGSAAAIVEARKTGEFTSLIDLCSRSGLGKRELEALIKAGACSSFGNRAQLLAVVDRVLKACGNERKVKAKEDNSLSLLVRQMFPDAPASVRKEELPDLDELPTKDCLALEKEFLGLYISGHPLDTFNGLLQAKGAVLSQELGAVRSGAKVVVAGVVTNIRKTTTKKGDLMAFVTIEDHMGPIEVIVFPTVYKALSSQLKEDVVVICQGKNDTAITEPEDDGSELKVDPKIIVDVIEIPDPSLGGVLTISIDKSHGPEVMTSLSSLLRSNKGGTPVYLKLPDGTNILTAQDNWVNMTAETLRCIEALVGKAHCSWIAG